jgi:phosphodiesterase/alkaline phosphatase D-like protein
LTRPLPRREFLRALAAAGAGGLVASLAPGGRAGAQTVPPLVFPDGVKSGDPAPRGAVVWTRIARPADGARVPITWTVAEC